ncbi:MAG TPA: hypothetical protein VD731_04730 [Nitrosopumilaceae archaeon]|nr:hypothetical protein [Nitrosopumilaceae archaeon]
MNFEIRVEKEYPSDWNKNLINSSMGNVYNTVEYSYYARDILNWQPLFLSIINNSGKIVSQAVIFEMTRSIGNKFPNSFKRIFSLTMNRIKWRYGPVIFSQEHNLVLNNFLKYIINLKTKIDGSLHPFFKGNLDNFNIKKIKWSTYIIDLQNNKNNIIQNFDKKSVRNNIKRSQERGVEIKEIDNDSIYEYSKLLNEYRLSINTSTYSETQVLELWRILTPVGFRGFIARKDDTNIAAITFSTFNGYINEWGIARSEKDTKEKLYAQDLLKWKIIEWGIENNQKYYDFSGFNPIPASEKEEGILRYKKKWGGTQYNFWILRT